MFTARDDGLWVVKEEAKHFGSTVVFDGQDGAGHEPEGGRGVAMIEPYDQAAIDSRGV